MTEDKNTPTDEPSYTAILSKLFTSFSGYSTSLEYEDACKRLFWYNLLILFLLLLLRFIWVTSIFTTSLIILILIPLVIINMNDYRICCRRFHVFGKSFTCWALIPSIVTAIAIYFIVSSCPHTLQLKVFLTLIFILMIVISLIYKMLGKTTDWDKAQYKKNMHNW